MLLTGVVFSGKTLSSLSDLVADSSFLVPFVAFLSLGSTGTQPLSEKHYTSKIAKNNI